MPEFVTAIDYADNPSDTTTNMIDVRVPIGTRLALQSQPESAGVSDAEIKRAWYDCGVGKDFDVPPSEDDMRFARAILALRPQSESEAPTVEAAREMGAKGGPVVEAERLAFEAWMAGHCWKVSPTWNGQTYDDSEWNKARKLPDPFARTTRMLWAAWRDRAALASLRPQAVPMTDAARDVLAERQRQISAEGWTPEHDDEHGDGSMAVAASCYACSSAGLADATRDWPWAPEWFKPSDKRRDLIKAGALILAEIERLDRASGITAQGAQGGEG